MPLSPTLKRWIPAAALLAAALASLVPGALTAAKAQAMRSPWWENYDRVDRYRCNAQGRLVLERNESQASLISDAGRMLLFREASQDAGLRYRNEILSVILRGDELTVEQPPQRLICLRTEEV